MSSAPAGLRSIVAIPAFTDNYLWLVMRGKRAAVVDPGDAAPVEKALARLDLTLSAIVLTHHHQDHTGGVAALVAARSETIPVFGPRNESIAGVTHPLSGGEGITVPGIDLALQVLDVPGHTRGHIAYVGQVDATSVVFCGDTLFAGGCGRLFEGTPEQMFASLRRLAALPLNTLVYCAHEYTQSNLRFALEVEPDNAALQQRIEDVAEQRRAGLPSVPSSISVELATNPFLRCDAPSIMASAENHAAGSSATALATFTALRAWKDQF